MCHHSFIALGEALKYNTTLTDLRVAWNVCHGEGLRRFSEGLASNKTLSRLDLSWNLLGREVGGDGPEKVAVLERAMRAFAEMIRKNKSLRHLSISNCCLSPHHALIVATAFNQNHTVTGIHYEGNTGMSDAKCFIHVNTTAGREEGAGNNPPGYYYNESVVNQCWECRCWQVRDLQLLHPPQMAYLI